MKKKFLLGGIAILSAAILLSGCCSDKGCGSASSTKNEITVGATAGPHAQVVEAAAKEAEKHGLTVHVKEFSDYITPDQALADGDIDIAVYQHKPFLENFNKQHNTDLVNIGDAILMRMGIYSNNYKNVNDIPSNPKNLNFKEIEAAQLPRSLDDVDASVITMNFVQSAGISPQEKGIFFEDKDNPLAVMIIATRAKDKDNENYKTFVSAYQSDAVKQFIKETFKGTIEAAWN